MSRSSSMIRIVGEVAGMASLPCLDSTEGLHLSWMASSAWLEHILGISHLLVPQKLAARSCLSGISVASFLSSSALQTPAVFEHQCYDPAIDPSDQHESDEHREHQHRPSLHPSGSLDRFDCAQP